MLRTMLTRGKINYDYGFSGKESKRIIHIQKGLKGASEQEAEEGWELWESITVIRIQVTGDNRREFYKFPLRPLQNMKLMFT